MRGRQSYGMLRTIGVADTVVPDEARYIDLAARLGDDPEARAGLAQRMRRASSRLYGDTRCVAHLEDFLRRATRDAARAGR